MSGHTDNLTAASNLIDEIYRKGEWQTKQQFRNALDAFHTQYMDDPSKLLERLAFNTRLKIQEDIIVVMDKPIHGKHLSQPLQTNNKQFKIAVTLLIVYISNVTDKNNKFFFTRSINDDVLVLFLLHLEIMK